MSEPAPEQQGGGGNFLTRKMFGLPVYVWALLVIAVAYLYFRSHGSSTGSTSGTNPVSSANNGTATTGNTTFPSNPLNITVNSQYAQTGTSSSNAGFPPPRHTTKNPQPTPKTKPPVKKHVTTVKTPARFVTVAKWNAVHAPWNSTLSGIAAHQHTTVAELLKLNPGIKNPNVIHPGQKVRY